MYLSKGNSKIIGDEVSKFLIFNLPAQKTCPGSTAMCRAKCYARKAEIFRCNPQRSVLACRERNYQETLLPTFTEELKNIIKSKTKRIDKNIYLRIHESGDFYSEKYFLDWLSIINEFPNIKFLAFTKSEFVKKYLNQIPPNFNLYFSVWEDSTTVVEGMPLAIAGNTVLEATPCHGKCAECMHCFHNRTNVNFKIH